MSIKNALQELLNALDQVEDKYPHIHDTMVRELLYITILDHFAADPLDTDLPVETLGKDFAMLRPKADKMIYKALLRFLIHPDVIEARRHLTTPQARLDAFQDEDVESSNGHSYGWYFGWP